MPIRYKVNIIAALKEAGYSTYKLRKEKLLGEATLQKFRNENLCLGIILLQYVSFYVVSPAT